MVADRHASVMPFPGASMYSRWATDSLRKISAHLDSRTAANPNPRLWSAAVMKMGTPWAWDMTDDNSVTSTRPRCEMRTARLAGLGLTGWNPVEADAATPDAN